MTNTQTSEERACAVPLVDMLRAVPREAVLFVNNPNALGCFDTHHIPVGRLCHEAAAASAAREEQIKRLRSALRDISEASDCLYIDAVARAALKETEE